MILGETIVAAVLTLLVVVAALYWMWLIPTTPATGSQQAPVSGWMTVAADEHLIHRDGDEYFVNNSVVETILKARQDRNLILIATALSDEEGSKIKQAVAQSALGNLVPGHRVILSEKEEGRISIVRQLQPSVHYEVSPSIMAALQGKVPLVVTLTTR